MRVFIVPLTLSVIAAGCNSDSALKKYNSDPEVFISSHDSGGVCPEPASFFGLSNVAWDADTSLCIADPNFVAAAR